MIVFPSQLDVRDRLLRLLGGFWSNTYEGSDLLAEVLHARAALTKQTFERLQEATDSLSRIDIPVFRKEYWRTIILKKSEINAFPNLYGEDIAYGSGAEYGVRAAGLPFVCPISEDIFDCFVITNRVTKPSVNLIRGLDFVVDKSSNVIRFKESPFNNDKFSKETLADGDEELTLWLYNPSIDRQYVYQHFGYLINLWAKSSESYKTLVNSAFDSIVLGTSSGKTIDAVSAITGIPVAKGGETVQAIEEDRLNLLIITDKNVYKFSKKANPIVSVGDELTEDQPLTDAFEYYEFNTGTTPAGIVGISVAGGLVPGQYVGELGFMNTTESTTVTEDVDGYTKITFPIGGHPFDVEAFWDDVHRRGVASGKTLANYLDTRTEKEGQPSAESLPKEINPLKFIVENNLRYGGFLIRIKTEALAPSAVGIDKLSYVRKLVPPNSAMVLIIDMPSVSEDVDPHADSGTEETSTFIAANTVSHDITNTDTAEIIVGRVVFGLSL
jgi:hypothetical protein